MALYEYFYLLAYLKISTNRCYWFESNRSRSPSCRCATGVSGRQRPRAVRQRRRAPPDSWLDQLPSASLESCETAPAPAAATASHQLTSQPTDSCKQYYAHHFTTNRQGTCACRPGIPAIRKKIPWQFHDKNVIFHSAILEQSIIDVMSDFKTILFKLATGLRLAFYPPAVKMPHQYNNIFTLQTGNKACTISPITRKILTFPWPFWFPNFPWMCGLKAEWIHCRLTVNEYQSSSAIW